ncbi:hypothetical protein GW17_00057310 [Ensete ventricosum]|nr:hypothetical protein GW17_00057310 [Ensete ventricosum]
MMASCSFVLESLLAITEADETCNNISFSPLSFCNERTMESSLRSDSNQDNGGGSEHHSDTTTIGEPKSHIYQTKTGDLVMVRNKAGGSPGSKRRYPAAKEEMKVQPGEAFDTRRPLT